MEYLAYSPEEIQQAIQKYEAWAGQLIQQGHLRGGDKLRDDGGRLVRAAAGQIIVDGPFAETKETVGGYYLVEVPDYAAAVEIACTCPILAAGGSVEVREIEPR